MYFVLSTWVVSIKRELRVAPKYSTQLNSTLIVSRCRLIHCHWRPRLPQRPLPPKKDILFNEMFLVYWFHWFLVAMHGMVEWVKRIGLVLWACLLTSLRLGGDHSWSQMITRFCKLKWLLHHTITCRTQHRVWVSVPFINLGHLCGHFRRKDGFGLPQGLRAQKREGDSLGGRGSFPPNT